MSDLSYCPNSNSGMVVAKAQCDQTLGIYNRSQYKQVTIRDAEARRVFLRYWKLARSRHNYAPAVTLSNLGLMEASRLGWSVGRLVCWLAGWLGSHVESTTRSSGRYMENTMIGNTTKDELTPSTIIFS